MSSEAAVFLKAVIRKEKLLNKASQMIVPSWKIKSEIEVLDQIINDFQEKNKNDQQDQENEEEELNFNNSILEKAKSILSERLVRKSHDAIDHLYYDIKNQTIKNSEKDELNDLVVDAIEQSQTIREELPLNSIQKTLKSKLKLRTEPIYQSYSTLPKMAISHRMKMKQENLKNLNQNLKFNRILIQEKTKHDIQSLKLPQIFENISIHEVQDKNKLQEYVVRGEFYLKNRNRIKYSKPPTFIQAFSNFNKQFIRSVDYQTKLNNINNQALKVQLNAMSDFIGNRFRKLQHESDIN